MIDDRRMWLTLVPTTGENGIAGRLRDDRGEEHRFTSWLGLLSLLQAARPSAPAGGDGRDALTGPRRARG